MANEYCTFPQTKALLLVLIFSTATVVVYFNSTYDFANYHERSLPPYMATVITNIRNITRNMTYSDNTTLYKESGPMATIITNTNTMNMTRYMKYAGRKQIYKESGPITLTVVPKVIYMLWDKGWEKAPSLQSICIRSIKRHNADFNIYAMNISRAEDLIHRKAYYSDRAWRNASIQAKSDIIRVELLARYGGIWADASIYCNEPFSNWLSDSLLAPDNFFAFERKDGQVTSKTWPWISSWFLVAANNSDMLLTWRNLIRESWAKTPRPPKILGYFWVHRLFRSLVLSNATFSGLFDSMPLLEADRPHCLGPKGVVPHIYKIKAPSCAVVRNVILAKENSIKTK